MGKRNDPGPRTSGMNTWRAGCGESRTSGSEGGPQKPTSRNADRALRSDPYTEHRTGTGKVYLAVVLDAWSRRVVGWSIADHLRAELVADAVQMATWRRQPPKDQTIAHSDHGSATGFNRSKQHRLVERSVGAGRGLGWVSSSRGSCGVARR